MVTRRAVIINATGLHARPATEFVTQAKQYAAAITVQNLSAEGSAPVNAKSLLRVLSAGLSQGSEVVIAADGVDEQQAADALAALIGTGFGE